MKQLASFLFLLLALTGCSSSSLKKEAVCTQRKLDQAEVFLQLRRFDKAEEQALSSIAEMDKILKKETLADYQLLKARAHMVLFMAKNTLVIERAPIQPKSFVALPDAKDYVNYEGTAGAARETLQHLLAGSEELKPEQRGYAESMLAVVLRLRLETASEASLAYKRSIEIYQGIKGKEEIVKALQMSRAEVLLLQQSWAQALAQLEEVMARTDLRYYAMQFAFLRDQLQEAERLGGQDNRTGMSNRIQGIQNAVSKNEQGKDNPFEQLAREEPRKQRIVEIERELTLAQNNLLYRIICYKQLGRTNEYDTAREIVRNNFPELDQQLTQLFKI